MGDADLFNLLQYLLNIFPEIQCLIDEITIARENTTCPAKGVVTVIVDEVTQFVDILNGCVISLHEYNEHSLIGGTIMEVISVMKAVVC